MERPWFKFYDPHVPRNLKYPHMPWQKILADAAQQFPDGKAVFFFGGKVTYGQLQANASQFAAALKGIDFRRGDRL